jgi:Putative esterase
VNWKTSRTWALISALWIGLVGAFFGPTLSQEGGTPNVDSPHFVYKGTDRNGVQVYQVTWATLGAHPFAVRVLTPDHPSTEYPHSFLYALPVEAGFAQSNYGNGLDQLQKLDIENRYNATIVEPIFAIDSYYADNPVDPTIDYETFTATLLPEWVHSHLATTGTEKNLLIGFSKSGNGALALELKHPSVFSAVAAWDFVADMSSYDQYGSSSSNDYGTETNFQDNYRLTSAFVDARKTPFTIENRIWISEGPAYKTQVAHFDALLTSHAVLHSHSVEMADSHTWFGGWLSGAVGALYGLEKHVAEFTSENVDSKRSSNKLFDGIKSEPVNNTPDLQCFPLPSECIASWSGHVVIITKATLGSTKLMRIFSSASQFGPILLAAALPGVWFLIRRRTKTKVSCRAASARSQQTSLQR